MPAVNYADLSFCVNSWTGISIGYSNQSKRYVCIKLGQKCGILFKPVNTFKKNFTDLTIKLIFKAEAAILCANKLLFSSLKLGSNVSFCICKRLLSLIVHRNAADK